jgi:hypothetical protein
MKNSVSFYEASYQFKSESTDLNISEDFILMILAKQYEYRATKETLWAILSQDGQEVKHYEFDPATGLKEIILEKSHH